MTPEDEGNEHRFTPGGTRVPDGPPPPDMPPVPPIPLAADGHEHDGAVQFSLALSVGCLTHVSQNRMASWRTNSGNLEGI